MTLSRSALGRRTIGPWTAGGCASRRSARSGSASLVYVVVVRGFIDPDVDSDHGLAWPLLGALPLFVFGMWLLTVSSSRIALLIALGSTAMLVGSAYETFVHLNVEILAEPWFPLFNVLGLTADAVATSTLLSRVRDLPRRRSRAPVAADRGRLPLDAGARRSAHPAHDAARRDVAVHRHQRRGDPQPVRRCRGSNGRPPPCTTSSSSLGGRRARPHRARLPCALRATRGARAHPRHGLAVARRWWRSCCGRSFPGIWVVEFLGLRVDDRHPGRRRSTASSGTARSTSGRAIAARASSARRTCSSRSCTRPPSRRPALLLARPLSDRAGDPAHDAARRRPAAGAHAGCSGGSTAPSSATASGSSRC